MQLTARAGWSKRFGHTIVITAAGAMVLAGSNNASDVWASLNGGYKWTQCRLQAGQTVTENSPAVALTGDEKLVVGSGYPRTDLWISDMSLTDPSRVAAMCQGGPIPDEGVGLRVALWDAASPDDDGGDTTGTASSSSGGLSAGVIILIVLGVLVGMTVLYGMWRHQKKTGSWNPLAPAPDSLMKMETGGTATHSALDSALMGDTSAGQPGGHQ